MLEHDFLIDAIDINGNALHYIPEKFLHDRNFIIKAAKESPNTLKSIKKYIQSNKYSYQPSGTKGKIIGSVTSGLVSTIITAFIIAFTGIAIIPIAIAAGTIVTLTGLGFAIGNIIDKNIHKRVSSDELSHITPTENSPLLDGEIIQSSNDGIIYDAYYSPSKPSSTILTDALSAQGSTANMLADEALGVQQNIKLETLTQEDVSTHSLKTTKDDIQDDVPSTTLNQR